MWSSAFQFHIGAIRRILSVDHFINVLQFQFHIGAIRSKRITPTKFSYYYWFQFHIGAIRSLTANRSLMSDATKFQFHIGAIRRCSGLIDAVNAFLRFNSILVQLEGLQPARSQMPVYSFQFHIGAIRSSTFFFFFPNRLVVSIPYWCN